MFNSSIDHLRLVTYLLVALFAASQAQADQATVGFMLLFGDDVRAVEATEETEDDARLADRLFQEAESGRHSAALTMLLYEKAYQYGMKDLTGYPTADQALGRMLEKDDARRLEIGDMRLALLEKWAATERDENQQDLNVLDPDELIDLYLDQSRLAAEARDIDRALQYLRRCNEFTSKSRSPRRNEVKEAIGELYKLRKLLKDIAELEEQLDADPSAADKLAMIHLTEFDDPAKAATYADRMSDKQLAAKVRLAALDFELATADNAKDTGAFYLGLVTDGEARRPVPMLIRAKAWLTEFLSHGQGGVEQIKAVNGMLAQVDEALLRQGVGQKLARIMAGRVRGDGQFERPADIQAAIDRGVAWLYTMRDPQRHWEQDTETHRNWGGYTSLVVYALLMADEDPRANRDLNRATNFMMNTDMKGTYALCFRIHAWEVLPQRERFRRVLQRDVMRLRGGLTGTGSGATRWRARMSCPARSWTVDHARRGAGDLDRGRGRRHLAQGVGLGAHRARHHQAPARRLGLGLQRRGFGGQPRLDDGRGPGAAARRLPAPQRRDEGESGRIDRRGHEVDGRELQPDDEREPRQLHELLLRRCAARRDLCGPQGIP